MSDNPLYHPPIEITGDALLAAGYTKFPPSVLDNCKCMYQKAIRDGEGRLYFIDIREWEHVGRITYDAQLHCDSDTDGYLWATIRENDLRAIERRIAALWEAAGSMRYDG